DNVPLTLEVRDPTNNALLFAVRRRGLLSRKVETVDAQGHVVGTYKAKLFSLTEGFHIYDRDGKHFANINGRLLKAEYRFLTPGGEEMGTVSRQWGGMARELFTTANTYGVRTNPEYVGGPSATALVLGAALAINGIFAPGGRSASPSRGLILGVI